MNLTLKTEVFGNENHAWLGSARGTESPRSGTLVLSAFTAADHYPDGQIPSGTPLSQFTSGPDFDPAVATYGPWTGTGALAGFLFTTQSVPVGMTTGFIVCSVLDTGRVIVELLPQAFREFAFDEAANPRFVFVATA
jgi:hypothetical protein